MSSVLQRILTPIKFKNKTADCQPSWSCLNASTNVTLRALVFRESSGKPRKLYFDSDTIRRDARIDRGAKCDQVCEGYSYVYEKSKPDVKHIGEMIFGTISTSGKSVGFKVHYFKEPDQQMWSTTFSSEIFSRGNSSFGSSFGSNLSSISLDNDGGSFPFLMDLERRSSERDSGIYSVTSGPNSNQPENRASSSTAEAGGKTESDISLPNWPHMRRMEGNVENGHGHDFSSHYSESSLRNSRWRCSLDLFDQQKTSPFKAVINSPSSGRSEQSGGNGSTGLRLTADSLNQSGTNRSIDHLAVNSPVPGKKPSSVLGLALIISTPPEVWQVLCDHSAFMEDLHNKFRIACVDAYQERHKFIHLVYEAWVEAKSDLMDLFAAPRLDVTAWHFVTSKNASSELSDDQKKFFVDEFLYFQNNFDTKDTNFFFSTFLSAFLTQNLGWVSTVAPKSHPRPLVGHESVGRKAGLPRWRAEDVQELCKDFYYDPQEVQFLDLHGMIGIPCKATKSVVFGSDRDLLRRFIFVVSYFLRCSVVVRRNFHRESLELEKVEYKTVDVESYAKTIDEERFSLEAPKGKTPTTTTLQKTSTARRALCSMGDEDCNKSDPNDASVETSGKKEEVIFLVGGSAMKSVRVKNGGKEAEAGSGGDHLAQESSNLSSQQTKMGESVRRSPPGVVVSSGAKFKMEAEETGSSSSSRGRVDVYMPLPKMSTSSGPALLLPALICQTQKRILPGTVIQGCLISSSSSSRSACDTGRLLEQSISRDLRASAENSFVSQRIDEFLCVSGDMTRLEVRLHSNKRGRINGPNLPLFPAPLVVDLMDAVSNFSFGDHELTMMIIEDKLSEIYEKSCLLAKYLMNAGLTKMEEVVEALKMEPNDIPLLLAVASTHSPEVSARYGVSVK